MQENSTGKNGMNIILAVVICLVLVGALIFINIKNKINMPLNNNVDDIANNVSDSAVPSDENAVLTEDVANPIEDGDVAKAGDIVSVNYTGRLEDGTVFDSNVDPKFNHVQSFEFTLGAGQVISGWDKGIVGMKVGEKKTLTIPPEDAYGANGQGPIPPNSTLIFDVEVLAIKS